MRYLIGHGLLFLSGFLKSLSYKVLRDGSIIVDQLTLPGWFIVDQQIVHQKFTNKEKVDFVWRTFPMPDEYCEAMSSMENIQRHK